MTPQADAGSRTSTRGTHGPQWTSWLAVLLFGVGTALVVADVALSARTVDVPRSYDDAHHPVWSDVVVSVVDLLSIALATALLARLPRNRVVWILVAAAFGFPLTDAAEGYVAWSLDRGVPLPGMAVVAWTTNWSWALTSLAVPFLFLLFPDGRPPGRRWRPVLWIAAANAAVIVVVAALWPEVDAFPTIASPFGVAGLTTQVVEPILRVGFAVHTLASIAGVASLVVRYRRGNAVERRQLLWFAYAAVLLVVILNVTPPSAGPVVRELLEAFAGLGLLVAVAVAVLRYRLYEIDRIISRTATYAVVSAVLLAVYALGTVLPAAVLGLESDLLVAAATLAAGALFVPLRRRVQAVVDRRFNRARYDAQQVVERFGSRLRDELDVTHLADDLGRVVRSTVQPAHLSLWLPEGGSS